VETVDRANLNAIGQFALDAGFCDDESHVADPVPKAGHFTLFARAGHNAGVAAAPAAAVEFGARIRHNGAPKFDQGRR
jgi:hypothetical protein